MDDNVTMAAVQTQTHKAAVTSISKWLTSIQQWKIKIEDA